MARKTESKVIGGDRYAVTQLGARQGQAVALRIMRAVAPAAVAKDAGAAIGLLVQNISESDLEYVTNALASGTLLYLEGGTKGVSLDSVYDAHFAGRLGVWSEWLVFAVMTNFADFFDEIRGLETPEKTS